MIRPLAGPYGSILSRGESVFLLRLYISNVEENPSYVLDTDCRSDTDRHEQSFYCIQNPKKSEPNTANPTSLCDSVLLVDFLCEVS